jgi:hypothetical protein
MAFYFAAVLAQKRTLGRDLQRPKEVTRRQSIKKYGVDRHLFGYSCLTGFSAVLVGLSVAFFKRQI